MVITNVEMTTQYIQDKQNMHTHTLTIKKILTKIYHFIFFSQQFEESADKDDLMGAEDSPKKDILRLNIEEKE